MVTLFAESFKTSHNPQVFDYTEKMRIASAMETKHFVSSNVAGEHRIAYQDWGDPNCPNVLVCVHGLTRNSRDFDFLATHLRHNYRVIAPDIVGRGQSDWLEAPEHYQLEQYLKDMVILLQNLKVNAIDWLGTSLGGMIGIALAAQPNTPIRRLVINDVGPIVKKETIQMMSGNLAKQPRFETLDELEAFLRQIYQDTGEHKPEHWQHMAAHDHRKTDAGYARAHDPNLFKAVGNFAHQDIDLWPYWDAIKAKTLVLHGEKSGILTPEICEEMKRRKPNTDFIHIPNVGHAPSLMVQSHIDLIDNWLATTQP